MNKVHDSSIAIKKQIILMKKIKVILIDDERLAREELGRVIAGYADLEVIAEAQNADEAVQLIKEHQPDLIFLDIQMPEKNGFDLLEMLDDVPEVVFVTAFDQYAVKAFEANALDYLVKPVRDERFAKVIEKIRSKLNISVSQAERHLFVKDGTKCHLIGLNEIFLIESMDNYARLYFNGKQLTSSVHLTSWRPHWMQKHFLGSTGRRSST